jgi:hypothetical protein
MEATPGNTRRADEVGLTRLEPMPAGARSLRTKSKRGCAICAVGLEVDAG